MKQKVSYYSLLFLVLFSGILFHYPTLDFQPLIAQGDHGRDLYSFQLTLQGKAPYKDFWWQYGPLMTYYYAQIFNIFDVSIQSALLGKFFIILGSGLLIYLISAVCMAPFYAFVCTMWFWVFRPDFFYTYNHIGGIFFILLTVYATCLYIKKTKYNLYLSRFYFHVFVRACQDQFGLKYTIGFFGSSFYL